MVWGKNYLLAVMTAALAATCVGTQAAADTIKLPGHQRTWTTDDGWRATVSADKEQILRVQPLTASGFSREAYVTLRARAGIARARAAKPDAKIIATLESGYQIGCMATMNEVTPSLGGSFGLSGTGGSQGLPVLLLNPQALIQPGIQVSLTPGKSIIVSLGKKPLESAQASVTVRSGHITVDGCIGTANIRSFSVLSIRTSEVDDQNAVYGRVSRL
ncbi:MspA family porin [Gordonia sp. CPCC 205333]|uniref:MspA family porin n=1 Tax=Gordonia sp. CPCC 205333 TaxID=3140790 RepID=UPI003AF3A9F0